MFITAACVKFLIKLRWPKTKSLYKNVKIDEFWPDLPSVMTLPWQRQISWTHG